MGRIRRCDIVGRGVSLEMNFEVGFFLTHACYPNM